VNYIQNLIDNSNLPILTAFLLGLLTAMSPCPLATNITAIGFISKDVDQRRSVFVNGLIYTLGRSVSYTALGIILYFGASTFAIAGFFQFWGERLLGPLLIVIGIFMLKLFHVNFFSFDKLIDQLTPKKGKGSLHVFLLGIVFALAFCPYSGVLYFGMLIPLTVSSAQGLFLPPVFALATGLPVILISWILAFTIGEIGLFYNKMKVFEKWFRMVVALVFLLFGIYYSILFFLL